jgi:hypothetical protein
VAGRGERGGRENEEEVSPELVRRMERKSYQKAEGGRKERRRREKKGRRREKEGRRRARRRQAHPLDPQVQSLHPL